MSNESVLAILKKQYDELIMAVENKHPDESRHETALRLIKQGQKSSDECGKVTT